MPRDANDANLGWRGYDPGMEDPALATFIRGRLPVSAVPGVAEIKLHGAISTSGLGRLAERDPAGFKSPYWAYHWAGELALARHLLDHPEEVVGRRVVDLGAGGGLVAIAAAKAGAAQVIAAEIDPYAVAALRLNAALNRADVRIVEADLTESAPPLADVILVGDLFYAADLAARVSTFLDRCAGVGQRILIGDPGRAYLPTARLDEIARYSVAETAYLAGRDSGVFTWIAT